MPLDKLRERLEPTVRAVQERAEPLRRQDVLGAASAIAFHAFLSLVPLVALTGWVAHRLPTGADTPAPFARLAPAQVMSLADAEFMRLGAAGDAVLPPLGIAGFLWLASGGVSVAMRVLERVLEATPRPFWRRRLLALGFVLASVLALSASTALMVAAMVWWQNAVRVASIVIPLAALWFLLGAFYRYGTSRDTGARSGFRSALVTLVLWLLVSLSFSLYVGRLSRYPMFYGGLATVAVLLVWLWLMALALIAGGKINAYMEKRQLSLPEDP
jgi:membrane protein